MRKKLVLLMIILLLVSACADAANEITPTTAIQPTESPIPLPPTETSAPTETPAQITEVIVPGTETIRLYSTSGEREYTIYIALPNAYSVLKKSYPVVYLLDGDLMFRFATEYSRFLNSADAIPELIIVGIDNSSHRDQDLLPQSEGVGTFLTFIKEELIPYVDGNYRTKPTERTLAGGSYGGLFTLYTLFHTPETFNRYIATTPALSKDDLIFKYEEEYSNNHSDLPIKLFISVGGREPQRNINMLYERLESRNYAGLELHKLIIEEASQHSAYMEGFLVGLRTFFGR